ncbi:hypothetical protein ACJJTC_001680 [Scirpophaga incertulas]
MAHLEGILEGQKSLEEKVNKKMEELQQQLLNAGPHKDTVAKVAEEFRTFRELIFNMIGLLRNQIEECVKHIELFENRHRQKALVFMGIPEVERESCSRFHRVETGTAPVLAWSCSREWVRMAVRVGCGYRRSLQVDGASMVCGGESFDSGRKRHSVWFSDESRRAILTLE